MLVFTVSCLAYSFKYYHWTYKLLFQAFDIQTQQNIFKYCPSVETIAQVDNETTIADFTSLNMTYWCVGAHYFGNTIEKLLRK